MSRVLPRILQLQPELLDAWSQLRERRAAEPGYVGADLIARLAAAWDRGFDAAEIQRVSHALAQRDPRGRPCMCGSWGSLPLWAALAFDGELSADLYAEDAGWTAAYCYLCRRTSIPPTAMEGGERCSICAGDGLAPTWVTNTINCPEMALGQVREPGLWFPVPCAGCGGWGCRWPGEWLDGGSDERGTEAPAAVALQALPVLEREGDLWRACFGDREARFADRVGLQYLAALLERPGHSVDVMELVAMRAPVLDSSSNAAQAAGLRTVRGGDAGAMLDDEARDAYKLRLGNLEQELHQARVNNDTGRAEALEHEREMLAAEISRAVGLGGTRRASDDMQRARKAVTKAIRDAIDQLAKHLPTLGDHLRCSIQTGLTPTYLPRDFPRPHK